MTYTTTFMQWLWADDRRLATWKRVEVAVLRAQAETGQIPHWWAETAQNTPEPTVDTWRRATDETGHELVGFLHAWGVEHVHIGLTSSDITDTALSILLSQANSEIARNTTTLADHISRLADRSGDTHRLGRTHGRAAVPTTAGHILRYWEEGLRRHRDRLQTDTRALQIAKISGPVGNYLHVTREVERIAAKRLNLVPATSATQILMRDGIVAWAGHLASLASLLEGIATEFRLLAHEQIGELTYPAGSSSSAMSHKANPNQFERVTGLARMARATYAPIAEGLVQWHERDMAHSSVERTLLPQLTSQIDYSLTLLTEAIDSGLDFDVLNAARNLTEAGHQTLTHSVQTALQLAGWSYREAALGARRLYRQSHTPQVLVRNLLDLEPQAIWVHPTPEELTQGRDI